MTSNSINQVNTPKLLNKTAQKSCVKSQTDTKSIRDDEEISVPKDAHFANKPLPKKNIWALARQQLRKQNNTQTVQETITQQNKGSDTIEVKAGYTMYDIAEHLKANNEHFADQSIDEIMNIVAEKNKIQDISKIQVGQLIKVPGEEKTEPANNTEKTQNISNNETPQTESSSNLVKTQEGLGQLVQDSKVFKEHATAVMKDIQQTGHIKNESAKNILKDLARGGLINKQDINLLSSEAKSKGHISVDTFNQLLDRLSEKGTVNLAATGNHRKNNSSEVNIVVLDDFKNKKELDGDGIKDGSHGSFVSESIDNAKVKKMHANDLVLTDQIDALKTIRENVEAGADVDAVNISMGKTWGYDDLNGLMDYYANEYNPQMKGKMPQITPENLKESMPIVRAAIKDIISRPEIKQKHQIAESKIKNLSSKLDKTDPNSQEGYKLQLAIRQVYIDNPQLELKHFEDTWAEIDKLSAQGVPVVIAAGNKMPNHELKQLDNTVNMYAIGAENAIVVSSRNLNTGQQSEVTAENNTVDIYAKRDMQRATSPEMVHKFSMVQKAIRENPSNPNLTQAFNGILWDATSFVTPETADKIVAPLSNNGYSPQQINQILRGANEILNTYPNATISDAVLGYIEMQKMIPVNNL